MGVTSWAGPSVAQTGCQPAKVPNAQSTTRHLSPLGTSVQRPRPPRCAPPVPGLQTPLGTEHPPAPRWVRGHPPPDLHSCRHPGPSPSAFEGWPATGPLNLLSHKVAGPLSVNRPWRERSFSRVHGSVSLEDVEKRCVSCIENRVPSLSEDSVHKGYYSR